MQRAVLRKKWQAVQIVLYINGSTYKKIELGLTCRISQQLVLTEIKQTALRWCALLLQFTQATLTKRLEEGSIGAVEPDNHSDDDRNCLKIQGPQKI